MCIINIGDVKNAPVAQLDRASGYGPEGCGFDLCRARQKETPESHAFRGFFLAYINYILSWEFYYQAIYDIITL